jgi:hypothetical protein
VELLSVKQKAQSRQHLDRTEGKKMSKAINKSSLIVLGMIFVFAVSLKKIFQINKK